MQVDYSIRNGERPDVRYSRLQHEFGIAYPLPVSEGVIDVEQMHDSFRMKDEENIYNDYKHERFVNDILKYTIIGVVLGVAFACYSIKSHFETKSIDNIVQQELVIKK